MRLFSLKLQVCPCNFCVNLYIYEFCRDRNPVKKLFVLRKESIGLRSELRNVER
jgi:hypothetical protein